MQNMKFREKVLWCCRKDPWVLSFKKTRDTCLSKLFFHRQRPRQSLSNVLWRLPFPHTWESFFFFFKEYSLDTFRRELLTFAGGSQWVPGRATATEGKALWTCQILMFIVQDRVCFFKPSLFFLWYLIAVTLLFRFVFLISRSTRPFAFHRFSNYSPPDRSKLFLISFCGMFLACAW